MEKRISGVPHGSPPARTGQNSSIKRPATTAMTAWDDVGRVAFVATSALRHGLGGVAPIRHRGDVCDHFGLEKKQ
jgi:hypothetical protein